VIGGGEGSAGSVGGCSEVVSDIGGADEGEGRVDREGFNVDVAWGEGEFGECGKRLGDAEKGVTARVGKGAFVGAGATKEVVALDVDEVTTEVTFGVWGEVGNDG